MTAKEKQTKWYVGQDVHIEYRYGRSKSGVVTKVGRTLVTVKGPHGSDQFRMDTGRINDSYGSVYIYTMEEIEQRRAASEAEKRLREAGARFDYAVHARLTPEQKHAIADILEGVK